MDHNASPFMALADELLIEIISHVEDRRSLISLSWMCSRLQRLSELFLYKSVLIENGGDACALIKKCSTRKIRRHAVHDLQICYQFKNEDGIEVMNPFLETFTQLRHLKVESPCCNDAPWSYNYENQPPLVWNHGGRIDIPALFEKALAMPLPGSVKPKILGQLQSLTLHSHANGEGSARYDLGNSAIIFLLSNLRFIKLSCYNIGLNDHFIEVLQKISKYTCVAKSTALETLVFEECNIDFTSFRILLQLPKALKNLTIGERMNHTSSSTVPLGFHLDFLEAFEPQRTSLTYFKHIGGGKYWSEHYLLPSCREDISYLQALETIELGLALDHKYMVRGLLPTLRKVRFLDAFKDDLDRKQSLLLKYPMWRSSFHNSGILHQIDFVLCRDEGISDLWIDEERREEVNRIAARFRAQNTEIAVYTPKPRKRALIPPYMYGEELPEEELSYVSSSPNMFGNKFYTLSTDARNVDIEDINMSAPSEAGDGELGY